MAPMLGVPITMWPSRRGARAAWNTAGARLFGRTVAPGALTGASSAGAGAGAAGTTRTANSTFVASSTTTTMPSVMVTLASPSDSRLAMATRSASDSQPTSTRCNRRTSDSARRMADPPSLPANPAVGSPVRPISV